MFGDTSFVGGRRPWLPENPFPVRRPEHGSRQGRRPEDSRERNAHRHEVPGGSLLLRIEGWKWKSREPIASMYGILTYIQHINQPNVGKYIITWMGRGIEDNYFQKQTHVRFSGEVEETREPPCLFMEVSHQKWWKRTSKTTFTLVGLVATPSLPNSPPLDVDHL